MAGVLFEGRWVDALPEGAKPTGSFTATIKADGSGEFPAEAGRYHLYASITCPFANRAMIMRELKGLHRSITLGLTVPNRGELGWEFLDGPGSTEDVVNGARYVQEVYKIARADYTGPASVPALFDRETKQMVNNESLQIARMFDTECDAIGDGSVSYYPAPLRARIDQTIDELGSLLGAPFKFRGPEGAAMGQRVTAMFTALNQRLGSQRYLAGDVLTEADVAFFPPLVRYDLVFAEGMKVAKVPPVESFPNLHGWLRELAQHPAFEVVDLEIIRRSGGVVDGLEAMQALRKPHRRG